MPLAGWQGARELAGQERRLGWVAAQAEERAAEMAIGGWDQKDRARFGLEAGLSGPIKRDRIDGSRFDMRRRDREDRQSLACAGVERRRPLDELIGAMEVLG